MRTFHAEGLVQLSDINKSWNYRTVTSWVFRFHKRPFNSSRVVLCVHTGGLQEPTSWSTGIWKRLKGSGGKMKWRWKYRRKNGRKGTGKFKVGGKTLHVLSHTCVCVCRSRTAIFLKIKSMKFYLDRRSSQTPKV